jgi:hypothetical protein
MKTLNWRHTDWSARQFVFSLGQEIIGQLTFHSSWNFNAVYTDNVTRLNFSQDGFWSGKILITRDEKVIGEIDSGILSKQTLKLVTGDKYDLTSNFWGRNVKWKNEKGETIVNYKQASMSSMGKGTINLVDSLTIELEKILVGSGLFVRMLIVKRIALTVAIVVPITVASRH